ncbi:hypothetical protein BJ878DRAFT_562239 [Calycina marina]|uniref:Uncharacterized protein n=1 Tax=Calycina marina TaxID=1763456 RepID=A0A9P8CI15_9HELO|nr:hypothetical protein BJ878DRAFT_562239 [Calycina marina]
MKRYVGDSSFRDRPTAVEKPCTESSLKGSIQVMAILPPKRFLPLGIMLALLPEVILPLERPPNMDVLPPKLILSLEKPQTMPALPPKRVLPLEKPQRSALKKQYEIKTRAIISVSLAIFLFPHETITDYVYGVDDPSIEDVTHGRNEFLQQLFDLFQLIIGFPFDGQPHKDYMILIKIRWEHNFDMAGHGREQLARWVILNAFLALFGLIVKPESVLSEIILHFGHAVLDRAFSPCHALCRCKSGILDAVLKAAVIWILICGTRLILGNNDFVWEDTKVN